MKRVFIVHGWDGHPDEQWFPWLKQSLEEKGYCVEVPQMPDLMNCATTCPKLPSSGEEGQGEEFQKNKR